MDEDQERTKAPEDLATRARKGVAANTLATVARNTLDILTSVVLARLLLPEEFGMVAVVSVFIGLSWVIGNLGMAGAVIQAKEITEVDSKVAFTISVMVGVGLTALLVVLSPWVAKYFGFPVLRSAMPVMSLQMLIAGAHSTPTALLKRRLQFGRLAIVTLSGGVAFSIAGIGLATAGYGLWSLVWAPVTGNSVSLLASVMLSGFVPGLSFSRPSMRKLLFFGSTLTAKNVFIYLSRQVDKFLVPKFLGAQSAGLYSRAFNYSSIPDARMLPLLYGVCFPVFSKLRLEPERFIAWYEKISIVVAVGIAPLLVGLCVTAEDFTLALFGPNWSGMVASLRILSIAGLFSALHKLGGAAIEASGKLRAEIVVLVIYSALVTVGCLIGVQHSIEAVSWAILLSSVVLFFMKGVALKIAIGLPLRTYFRSVLPSVVAALIMAIALQVVVYSSEPLLPVVSSWKTWSRLALAISLGATVYLASLWMLGREHLRLVARESIQHLAPALKSLRPGSDKEV